MKIRKSILAAVLTLAAGASVVLACPKGQREVESCDYVFCTACSVPEEERDRCQDGGGSGNTGCVTNRQACLRCCEQHRVVTCKK